MMMPKKAAVQPMVQKSIQNLKLFNIQKMTGLPIPTGMIIIAMINQANQELYVADSLKVTDEAS